MRFPIMASMAAALALALSACGDTATDTVTDSAVDDDTLPVADTVPAVDASSPQGFVDAAASGDLYEIEAGKLAQQLGTTNEVKGFGAMMERDHTASSRALRTAVGEAGGALALPIAMSARHQAQIDALRNAGADFDAIYANQQVAAHQEALALMQAQAANGTLAPLKAHAAAVVSTIEKHLAEARELP